MARESFDKEIQFLRLLALTGDAYNRQQFASRLGISVHTYDKRLRNLKDVMSAGQRALSSEQGAALTEALRYNHYETADPLLLFLFRAKSLKASESVRITLILSSLREEALTAMELMDVCSAAMPIEYPAPDEKTIRGDLKYLEEMGTIVRLDGKRPYRYRASTELLDNLSDEELLDLYDFVSVMANTTVPSVQGYLLRDTIKRAIKHRGDSDEPTDIHVFKYHYHSRILDEAHLHTIHKAIRERRKVSFLYLSPKREQRYASQNTNPLFERPSEGVYSTVLPLRVIYDHQYGRWYLVGQHAKQGLTKFRMEGLTGLELEEAVTEEEFQMRLSCAERQLRQSWVIDTMRPVTIVARFFKPEGAKHDFVRERVLSQGQWGTLSEESDTTFLYEITINGITEIKPWLRSFGSSCEVLKPAWLRKQFIQEWKELHAYYDHEPLRENI